MHRRGELTSAAAIAVHPARKVLVTATVVEKRNTI